MVVESSVTAFTSCVSTDVVDPAKLEFPPYTAVIECDPVLKDDVANVAWPLPFREPVPNVVAPSMNVTVPVGTVVFPLGPATVAVNVTCCPAVDGFCDDVTAVVVAGSVTALTTCANAGDVDPAKVEFPP